MASTALTGLPVGCCIAFSARVMCAIIGIDGKGRITGLYLTLVRALRQEMDFCPGHQANFLGLLGLIDKRVRQVEETASPGRGYYDPVRNGTL
jgi:hypothetical protein